MFIDQQIRNQFSYVKSQAILLGRENYLSWLIAIIILIKVIFIRKVIGYKTIKKFYVTTKPYVLCDTVSRSYIKMFVRFVFEINKH